MNPQEEKRKAGRPKAGIDWAKVDNFLKAGCTGVGIAGLLGMHPNTLYEACKEKFSCNFSEYSQQKRAVGDDLLRTKQFDLAMKGDRAMLVWLGKQRLDQHENPIHKIDTSIEGISFKGKLTKDQLAVVLQDLEDDDE